MLYRNYMLEGFGKKTHYKREKNEKRLKRGFVMSFLKILEQNELIVFQRIMLCHQFINDRRIPDSIFETIYYYA